MEKKRYILFGYEGYYPRGGMSDAQFSFNDAQELRDKLALEKVSYENYQVFDTETFKSSYSYSPEGAFLNLDL